MNDSAEAFAANYRSIAKRPGEILLEESNHAT